MVRFHLAQDVIDRLPKLRAKAAYLKQELRDKLIDREFIHQQGQDMPEVSNRRRK
jgi:xylulose-5-phosphate/fructose-6-phosphate phosphoketolase